MVGGCLVWWSAPVIRRRGSPFEPEEEIAMASLVLRPPVLALPHFAAMSLSAAATAELRALSPATRAELASLSASPSAAAAALARALAPPPSPDDAAPADLRDEGCMDDEEACEALDTGTAAASQPDDAALAAAAALREAAAKAATEGDWSAAVAALTSAIAAPSATLLSRRAEALLALRRPVAALRDADAALLLNADSARALRAQGLAHRARGEWAAAAASLGAAQRVDFDAATDPVLRLCVDKAAIVRKRRVDAEHASAAEAAARAARAAEAAKAAKSSAARAGVVRSVHSPSEFDALLAEGFPVVVDFTAAWCGPCKAREEDERLCCK